MTARDGHPPQSRGHRGAVLITGLVLLVAMTIIGVTAMQTTVLDERMAGNLRDYNVAFQAAEAGLQAGIAYLAPGSVPDPVWRERPTSLPKPPDGVRVLEPCTVVPNPGNRTACDLDDILADWTNLGEDPTEGMTNGELAGGEANTGYGDSANPPRIAIFSNDLRPGGWCSFKQITQPFKPQDCRYTVMALGFGIKNTTRVVLQTTVLNKYSPL